MNQPDNPEWLDFNNKLKVVFEFITKELKTDDCLLIVCKGKDIVTGIHHGDKFKLIGYMDYMKSRIIKSLVESGP